MTTKAKAHAGNEYHLEAMMKMKEFIDGHENPTQAVDVILQSRLHQIMGKNQRVIESLLKIVLLCGKQGLALCGHRADHINWSEESSCNQGNFVQLVHFWAETNSIPATHL